MFYEFVAFFSFRFWLVCFFPLVLCFYFVDRQIVYACFCVCKYYEWIFGEITGAVHRTAAQATLWWVSRPPRSTFQTSSITSFRCRFGFVVHYFENEILSKFGSFHLWRHIHRESIWTKTKAIINRFRPNAFVSTTMKNSVEIQKSIPKWSFRTIKVFYKWTETINQTIDMHKFECEMSERCECYKWLVGYAGSWEGVSK